MELKNVIPLVQAFLLSFLKILITIPFLKSIASLYPRRQRLNSSMRISSMCLLFFHFFRYCVTPCLISYSSSDVVIYLWSLITLNLFAVPVTLCLLGSLFFLTLGSYLTSHHFTNREAIIILMVTLVKCHKYSMCFTHIAVCKKLKRTKEIIKINITKNYFLIDLSLQWNFPSRLYKLDVWNGNIVGVCNNNYVYLFIWNSVYKMIDYFCRQTQYLLLLNLRSVQ